MSSLICVFRVFVYRYYYSFFNIFNSIKLKMFAEITSHVIHLGLYRVH